MTYKITYSKAFKKHYKSLSDFEKKQTKNKIKIFVEDPRHPSLRTKIFKLLMVYGNLLLIWTLE